MSFRNYILALSFLSIMGIAFFPWESYGMLTRILPRISFKPKASFYRSYHKTFPLWSRGPRFKNSIKIKEKCTPLLWRSFMYKPIDFNSKDSLSAPVSFLEAGPGSIHEGSIEYFSGNSLEEVRGGFPHMYIDTLEELSLNPFYGNLKRKILHNLKTFVPDEVLKKEERSDEENKEILKTLAIDIHNIMAKTSREDNGRGWENYFKKIFLKGRKSPHYLIKLSDFFDEKDENKEGLFYGDCRVVNTLLGLLAMDLGIPAEKLYLFNSEDPVTPFASSHFNLIYKEDSDRLILMDAFYPPLIGQELKIGNKAYYFPSDSLNSIRYPQEKKFIYSDSPEIKFQLQELKDYLRANATIRE